MSFIKRLGNVVKGSVSLGGKGEFEGLSEAALREELARITPGQEAKERLAALKRGEALDPRPSAAMPDPDDAATDDQAAKLRALAKRFEAGEIDQRTYDRERAIVLHGPSGMPQRTL
jgi:glycine/D-amino acid oxidase-like deaminating enzyme